MKYREDHKYEVHEKKREYRIKHAEQLEQHEKPQTEEHKKLVKQKHSKLIVCECGRQVAHQSKVQHIRTQTHQQLMHALSLSSSATASD